MAEEGVSRTKLETLLGGRVLELKGGGEGYIMELVGKPSCSTGCPAGVNVKAYVNFIADRRYKEAYDTILERNPFPGICGRVCTHPCEEECGQAKDGKGMAIRHLKRFVSDYEMSRRPPVVEGPPRAGGERVAIIGSGPAGLTAASDLAKAGLQVHVFDAETKPGGMMRQGIPEFRLPRRILDHEIGLLRGMGVDIRSETKVEDVGGLLSKGYSAVVLAAGAVVDLPLVVEGSGMAGTMGAIQYLRACNLECRGETPPSVLVIGGGSSAFDAARTALRNGARKVTIAYRRTEEEMPADTEEIEQAKEEGIKVITLAIPKRLAGEGTAGGMVFLKARLGEPDKSGRPRPIPIERSEFTVLADLIITAIGSKPELPGGLDGIRRTGKGTVETDEYGATGIEGVFAAGDIVLGPSSIVECIGSGHRAAVGVMRYLGRPNPTGRTIEMPLVKLHESSRGERLKQDCLTVEQRMEGFAEVDVCAPEHMVFDEAGRCLSCGSCHECTVCLATCGYKQVAGLIGGKTFIIKVPPSLASKVYDGMTEWSVASEGSERHLQLLPLTPSVERELCIACGRCEEACPYKAIEVVLKLRESGTACISHDLCRSCGACTAACPTGAITQGPMSDLEICSKIATRVETDKQSPVVFQCHWGRCEQTLEGKEVVVMCTRMVRSIHILRALALGSPGVMVVSCPDDARCHYLPSERDADDVVKETRELLELIGIDPKRAISKRANDTNISKMLHDFQRGLDAMRVTDRPAITEPPMFPSPIERGYADVIWLAQNPDRPDGTSGMGPLHFIRILNSLLKAEGLDVLEQMAGSLTAISKDNPGAQISELLAAIPCKVAGDRTLIAIHLHDGDPINRAVRERLRGIEDLELVELRDDVRLDDWTKVNRESRTQINRHMEEARRMGAHTVSCSSPLCLAMMKLATREGSWRETELEVKDPFTLMLELGKRGGGA